MMANQVSTKKTGPAVCFLIQCPKAYTRMGFSVGKKHRTYLSRYHHAIIMFASRRVEVTDGIMLCSLLLLDHDWILLAKEYQVGHSVTVCLPVWLLIYL